MRPDQVRLTDPGHFEDLIKMKAVVFKGRETVALEDVPMPKIQAPTDVILKVRYSALCGRQVLLFPHCSITYRLTSLSELHVFRGHQASATDFVMGHEFTGEVFEVGSGVRGFQKGDRVVSPFTISCGSCFFCEHGFSSRCAQSGLFGTVALDGGQAEYVLVPLADSTLFTIPETIEEKRLVLMADIFPTGYFAAKNAFSDLSSQEISQSTVLLFGCGPVGLCALVSALEYKPKTIIAIDRVSSRLETAQSLGAEPWNFEEKSLDDLKQRIQYLTDGRGADFVIEVVGHSSALRMGFDLLRPWGRISSVGVHNENIPWTGNEAYGKNLRLQMGRCPVRSRNTSFHSAITATANYLKVYSVRLWSFFARNSIPLGTWPTLPILYLMYSFLMLTLLLAS